MSRTKVLIPLSAGLIERIDILRHHGLVSPVQLIKEYEDAKVLFEREVPVPWTRACPIHCPSPRRKSSL